MRLPTTVGHPLRIVLATVVLSLFVLFILFAPSADAAATPTPTPTKSATPAPRPPDPIKASDVLNNAAKYVGVPYVYGGFSPSGFDCSGYISTVWQVARRTTDTMHEVTRPIAKDELLPGDALNYPLPGAVGHIRIFDKWATADRALVWVYEATEPQVFHRVVPYDPRYQPVRRINIVSNVPMPPPPPLPVDWNKPFKPPAAPAAKPPAVISGRVTEEKSGRPVAMARVFYWTDAQQYLVSSVVTDADGRFTTPKIPAGMYEMAAYAGGYDVEFRGGLDVRSGGSAAFEIKLAAANGPTAGSRIGPATAVETTNAAKTLPPGQPPAALPLDYEVPGGWFFTQTAGRDGISGFAVTDDAGVKFWSEFRRLGGVGGLGYPVSRRFIWKGFTVQVMQKGVLQWRPEVGQAWLTNVFDELHDAGKDDWLLVTRSTPRPLDPTFDGGKPWGQVIAGRLALLDPQPPIDRRYGGVSDPLTFFGLPTSRVEDMGNHLAVRLQRAVIQLWKVEVPWAKAGETTVANGGDVAKEAGLFPADVLVPQRSPLLKP